MPDNTIEEGNRLMIGVKLPTTSELFKHYFNDYGQAGLHHKNIEAFFHDLNAVCAIEDSLKEINAHKPPIK